MNKYELLKQFLNAQGYFELMQDTEKQEEFFQNLTAEEFMHIITTLNKKLRGLETDERCVESNMTVGDLIAPSASLRNEIIENLIQSLKHLKSPKQRAALIYYNILNLHMFGDGNGRTARLLYDLVTNELGDEVWYIHEDDKSHNYEGSFEECKGIEDITQINQFANGYLKRLIAQQLKAYPELSRKSIITAGARVGHTFVKDIMPDNISSKLSKEELEAIEGIMSDSCEGEYTISGLTMLTVAERKGQLQEWIDYDNKCIEEYAFEDPYNGTRLCLRAWRNPPMLESWNVDDYREVISIGNFYKLQQFRILNDMFVNPEQYQDKQAQPEEPAV